ncbi:MAG TPA: IS110 family transposase [Candidatus Binatia bacterium]|nr:IS110 family transposase [Candidatus Binatia bacterium]
MSANGITFVGMDAHKKAINLAMLLPGERLPVEWQVANEPAAIRRLAKKLVREAPGEVRCCYEAGPCGYALQRELHQAGGVVCEVVAPSLTPVKPGEHIKTDRRDARKLAELFRGGLLTEVHAPTADQEAVRDLSRCREDAQEDLTRSRQRMSKFLLRRALIFRVSKRAWGVLHRQWLRGLTFEHAADQAVFGDYLLAIEQLEERVRTLDAQLAAAAEQEPYREPVAWLRCFRGIDTVTAITLVAELHDFRRFRTARELMAYLGLVPSEYSSGNSRHRGAITKAGNCHARRVLVEAAWHYRHRSKSSATLRRRRQGQPARVIALADRAQERLCRRYRHLVERGKPTPKVVVAIARELVGFLWAVWAGLEVGARSGASRGQLKTTAPESRKATIVALEAPTEAVS